MNITVDRAIGIGGIIFTLFFGILSLVQTETRIQTLLYVFTFFLFITSLLFILKGEKVRDVVRALKDRKYAKAKYKVMKKIGIKKKSINYRHISKDTKTVIKYGYSRFQDTILPLFFDYVHRRALHRYDLAIEFVQIPWNAHCLAFEEQKVDVSLSNFSSLLPFYASLMAEDSKEVQEIKNKAPSIFFPFFEFQGHGVFARADLLDKIKEKSRRIEIKGRIFEERKCFFEIVKERKERKKIINEMFHRANVVYEPNSDLEAAIDTLFTYTEVNKNAINPNWEETRLGYKKFLSGDYDVYCGGLVEAFSLDRKFNEKKSMDFFPLCTGKDLNVVSPNGLITTKDFLNKHYVIFRELIEAWFWSINQLKFDIKNADKSLIDNIINFLNTSLSKTNSGMSVHLNLSKELLSWMINRDFEHFYSEPIKAFDKYYSDFKCQLLSNSFSFALLAPPETSSLQYGSGFKQIGPMEFARSLRTLVLQESRKFLPEYHLGYSI